jgi:hypothetical protein
VQIAIDLATLTVGDLSLVLLDGLEQLDGESLIEFRRYAQAHPEVQFVVTRVAGARGVPLAITEER